MQIFKHKNFSKQYKRLSKERQDQVNKALIIFFNNPLDQNLRNHSLKGKYAGLNSIDAAFDLRIIFRQEKNYAIVFLLKVGSHNQLY